MRSLISIIVPVYNASERLESCLDSLLAQEFRDFELILVDDGSTDRSPEICRRYRDREPDRITFLSGPNRGVSAARNRGLDHARGGTGSSRSFADTCSGAPRRRTRT